MDKPNLKKRIGRSPDRGDAFLMTFVYDDSMEAHSRHEEDIIVTRSGNTDPHSAI